MGLFLETVGLGSRFAAGHPQVLAAWPPPRAVHRKASRRKPLDVFCPTQENHPKVNGLGTLVTLQTPCVTHCNIPSWSHSWEVWVVCVHWGKGQGKQLNTMFHPRKGSCGCIHRSSEGGVLTGFLTLGGWTCSGVSGHMATGSKKESSSACGADADGRTSGSNFAPPIFFFLSGVSVQGDGQIF